MTAKDYILGQLEELKTQKDLELDLDSLDLEDFIFRSLMSKKFRKYAAKPELIAHIKEAIKINVANNQPINITFVQGAYKLWRLEEAPEADWAELFAAIYYSNWVKDICLVYEPGVHFDFFVADLILPKINNLSLSEVDAYINSFQKVLDFLTDFQAKNLKMTITRVGDQFSSPEAFDLALEKNIKILKQKHPVFSEEQLSAVEFNARPSQEQLKDSEWREKVRIIHDAYIVTSREAGYHFRPEKILAFSQPLPSGTVLAVGTTKTSIAKFWVGVGVLKRKAAAFKEYILSPKQLAASKFEQEEIKIDKLTGKNFKKIKIVD